MRGSGILDFNISIRSFFILIEKSFNLTFYLHAFNEPINAQNQNQMTTIQFAIGTDHIF